MTNAMKNAVHDRNPLPNEPDPHNERQRPMQGGADGLPEGGPTMDQTYGQMKYMDGDGPFANVTLSNGTGSGLSGMPQADAGAAPPEFGDPKNPPAPKKIQA